MTRLGGPPVEYLRECSNTSLRYFEMSKLEHVANLRRELTVLLDEMMEESALALFARWMLEKRSLPASSSRSGNEAKLAESRRARSLLAQFIAGAILAPESRPGANGQAGKPRGEDHVPGESNDDPSVVCRNAEGRSREQGPPQRGPGRSERQIERRRARAARAGARTLDGAS